MHRVWIRRPPVSLFVRQIHLLTNHSNSDASPSKVKSNIFIWFLTLTMLYLTTYGPVAFIVFKFRLYNSFVGTALRWVYTPHILVAKHWSLYKSYVNWWIESGSDLL